MPTTQLRHMTINQVVAGAVHHAVTAFLLDRQSSNLSKNTLAYYRQEVGFFVAFLDSQGVTLLEELTPEVIRLYLVDLSQRRNGGGCHAAFRAIRALLLWAWEEYDLPTRNPITRVKPPKHNTAALPGVEVADVQRLIDVCDGDKLAVRDRAALMALLDTGARAFEFTAWIVSDYEPATGRLTIAHGKGDKRRAVFVGKTTRRALLAYLRTRGELADDAPLFATQDGRHFAVGGLRRMIEKRAEQAGIDAPGLHDFRRAFAVNMLRAGVDIYNLAELMGHSDIQVLRRYLKLVEDDLREAHGKGSPVERMTTKKGRKA